MTISAFWHAGFIRGSHYFLLYTLLYAVKLISSHRCNFTSSFLKNLLIRVLPSWWNCHFKNRDDNQRNKLKWGLWQGEKLQGKKQKPGLHFLPFPLPHHMKIISLPQNKQISTFWNNIFERACFYPGAEYMSNSYTPQENNFPPRYSSYSSR